MGKLVVLAVCIFLGGCFQSDDVENYQLINNGSQVYRLNTKTGEIVVFDNDGIKRYDDAYILERGKTNSSLGYLIVNEEKSFPESDGQMWCKLKYKWRNDKILYQLTFGPYSDKLGKSFNDGYDSVTLTFLDADGFDVVAENVPLNSLTRIVGFNGKLSHWSKEGEIQCSKDDYQIVSGFSMPWYFSEKLKNVIESYTVSLINEYDDLLSQVSNLIQENKIEGKLEEEKVLVKSENGYKHLKPKDREFIKFVVENPGLFRTFQEPNTNTEQDTSGDR